MHELLWMSKAVASILDNQRRMQKNQEDILRQLEEFKEKLQQLGKQIDEQILVDFRTGMRHLLAAFNSDVVDVRNEEYRMARSIFGKLCNLNPEESTAGTSGVIENPYLICMGYWGSYQYFSLRGDQRNALVHAYECTMRYPGIALLELELFPADIFSKDYTTLTKEASARLSSLTALLDQDKRNKLFCYGMKGLRIVTAGAAAAGAGAVAGLFTAGSLATAAAAAAFHGVYRSIDVSEPEDIKVEDIKKEVERLAARLVDLETELVEECENRLQAVQRVSLKDLKGISSL